MSTLRIAKSDWGGWTPP